MGRLAASKGYTIDQTILIVAIIAILITLIIVTIGWQLIGKSGGAKLAAEFQQVEQACGTFFATNGVWPTQAFSSGPTAYATHNALLVLAGSPQIVYLPQIKTPVKNLLSGLKYDSLGVYTSYGKMGTNKANSAIGGIGEVDNPVPDKTGRYLVFYWHDVPYRDALELERIVDGGAPNFATGKVTAAVGDSDDWVPSGSPAVRVDTNISTLVNLAYIGNSL